MQKNLKIIMVAFLLAGFSSCSSMMRTMMKARMFDHYVSKYDFNTTYDNLKDAIEKSKQWKLLDETDNEKRYQDYGNLKNYRVLHICVPSAAVKILKQDEMKHMGAMIPMKMTIYETSSGVTKISVMDVGMMSKMFKEKEVKEEVKLAAEELEAILEVIADEE